MRENTLFYGDNLNVLREHVQDESVDLIYLDPPFQSGKDYNIIFRTSTGSAPPAQVKAFADTWKWSSESERLYRDVVEGGGALAERLVGLRQFLKESDIMAYLAMMAPRLLELRRVLKATGSIYLHCDPGSSHYLKLLMDGVFGTKCFRNEIIWRYRRWPARTKRFQRMHDVLLYYTKGAGDGHTFNQLYDALAESTVRTWGTKKQAALFDDQGNRLRSSTTEAESEGAKMCDVWDIKILAPVSKERTGFPTQKPQALLERIIAASSNEGDVVLDPFCGCGTAVAAAEHMKRRWIGIDVTHLAINLIKHRLVTGGSGKFKVIGEPTTLDGATELAHSDAYQFQWWALGLVGARPAEERKGADKGIDGQIFFHDEGRGGATKRILISVKAGHTGVAHVRDLRGVIERESAQIGVLITMNESTRPMLTEAAKAGFYESSWGAHPRLQVLTVEQVLSGKSIDYPGPRKTHMTIKRTLRKTKPNENLYLPGIVNAGENDNAASPRRSSSN